MLTQNYKKIKTRANSAKLSAFSNTAPRFNPKTIQHPLPFDKKFFVLACAIFVLKNFLSEIFNIARYLNNVLFSVFQTFIYESIIDRISPKVISFKIDR